MPIFIVLSAEKNEKGLRDIQLKIVGMNNIIDAEVEALTNLTTSIQLLSRNNQNEFLNEMQIAEYEKLFEANLKTTQAGIKKVADELKYRMYNKRN